MNTTESQISEKFSLKRILIPLIIGLAAATFLLVENLGEKRFQEAKQDEKGVYEWVDNNGDGIVNHKDSKEFKKVKKGEGKYVKKSYKELLYDINWTWYSTLWLFVAILMMVIRDVAYMYRIRVMTDYAISWRRSLSVIMLWEFASAATPSIVGGAGIALFIVNREGISMGKSTAIVMVTAMLDELFYITMVPTLLLVLGTAQLFPENLGAGITQSTMGIFWVGYFFLFLLILIILLAVFRFPRNFKYILIKVFKLPFLKKFRYNALKTGNDIIVTSTELKGKPFKFWFKAYLATFFSWTGRYWVVNFIIMAFTTSTIPLMEHFLIYARQLVVWVIMLISPTPGGSGVAEIAFSGFLEEFIPLGLVGALAFLWRLISYYPYLFIGAAILPGWLKNTRSQV
ncbi:MAG: YbhN family protein [Flavobacteriales bacterium]